MRLPEAVEPGLDIRMDLWKGKTWAKLPDVVSKDAANVAAAVPSSPSASAVDGNGAPIVTDGPSKEQLAEQEAAARLQQAFEQRAQESFGDDGKVKMGLEELGARTTFTPDRIQTIFESLPEPPSEFVEVRSQLKSGSLSEQAYETALSRMWERRQAVLRKAMDETNVPLTEMEKAVNLLEHGSLRVGDADGAGVSEGWWALGGEGRCCPGHSRGQECRAHEACLLTHCVLGQLDRRQCPSGLGDGKADGNCT